MANALKSVLRNPLCGLLFKVFVWGLALLFLRGRGLSFAPIAFVFASSVWVYGGRGSETRQLTLSFLSILILSFTSALYLKSDTAFYSAISLLGASLFFIAGIRNMIFLRRKLLYRLAQFLIFFLLFLLFFSTSNASLFFTKYSLIFIFSLLLFYEGVTYLSPFAGATYRLLLSAGFALVILEFSWSVILLPINFMAASSLMAIAVFLIFNAFTDYVDGKLSSAQIYSYAVILALAIAMTFALTR